MIEDKFGALLLGMQLLQLHIGSLWRPLRSVPERGNPSPRLQAVQGAVLQRCRAVGCTWQRAALSLLNAGIALHGACACPIRPSAGSDPRQPPKGVPVPRVTPRKDPHRPPHGDPCSIGTHAETPRPRTVPALSSAVPALSAGRGRAAVARQSAAAVPCTLGRLPLYIIFSLFVRSQRHCRFPQLQPQHLHRRQPQAGAAPVAACQQEEAPQEKEHGDDAARRPQHGG